MKRLALLLVLPALIWAAAGRRPAERRALAALEVDAVDKLCAEAGYPGRDFWERARAIGVGAAVMREETLADLAARGDVLAFGKAEIEKWRALGLVAPSAPVKPGALWVKDAAVVERLVDSAERRAEQVSTSAAAGYTVVEFPDGGALTRPAGLDPEQLKLVRSLSLAVVLDDLAHPGFAPRVLDASARLPAALRAVHSHPARLLVIRLHPSLGVEGNLERLRGLLKPLREAGVALTAEAPPAAPPPGLWRLVVAWLIAALGPLLCARVGLEVFRQVRSLVLQRRPEAAPVPELAAGIAGAAAAAVALGLLMSLALGPGLLEPLPAAAYALAAPAAVGFVALYPFDGRRKLGGRPVTVRDAAAWALAAGLAYALLAPRAALQALGLWEAGGWLAEGSNALWWWRLRWRELAVGYPALLHALYLLERRLDCPGCLKDQPLADPRPWLLAGLLGPAGTVAAIGHPGAPLGAALAQSVWALLLGLCFGAALIGLRLFLVRRSEGPKPDRSIDPVLP